MPNRPVPKQQKPTPPAPKPTGPAPTGNTENVAESSDTANQVGSYRLTSRDHIRGAIWGFSEPFRRDRTAALASLLALLLAVAPGVAQRIEKGTWGEYDPTIAVLTATLIALIWTAHYTFRAVRHARQAEERENVRRRLARQSMALGVMAELDYLGPSLALMHRRVVVHGIEFLERPLLRHALAHIDAFSNPAATDLSRFDSVLRQIESHAALYGADHFAAADRVDQVRAKSGPYWGIQPQGLLDYDPKEVANIREIIAGAQALIPLLKTRLLGEC